MSERVWHASYGLNLSAARFATYLQGGRPPGATRTYPGARDASPPSSASAIRVPGQIFFGWESRTWGGGIAFFDPSAPGEALMYAYRITVGQFADVLSQEMHRSPDVDLDLLDLHALEGADGLRLGPGRYETVRRVATIDGTPVLTFTCDQKGAPALNSPTEPYLGMISRGLREAHALSPSDIADYLAPLDGIDGHWTRSDLTSIAQLSGGSSEADH